MPFRKRDDPYLGITRTVIDEDRGPMGSRSKIVYNITEYDTIEPLLADPSPIKAIELHPWTGEEDPQIRKGPYLLLRFETDHGDGKYDNPVLECRDVEEFPTLESLAAAYDTAQTDTPASTLRVAKRLEQSWE